MSGADILLTGANGQVGRACFGRLREAGFGVVGVSRDGTDGLAIDLSAPFREGLARSFDEGRTPRVIVHLAAAVPHDPRYPDDAASAAVTRAIDCHIHEAAVAWDCRVIYMSTCAVYDRHDTSPKTPDSPLARDLSPYAAAKRAGEVLFAERGATVLRLSAPTGAHSRPNLVFGRFAERCRKGLPIELWGDGRREQDFIHIDDVCDLILSAIQQETTGISNCASGRAVTMAELADAMTRFYRRGSVVFAAKPDPLDGETARYDIEDTKRRFRWAPTRGLTEMMQSLEQACDAGAPLGGRAIGRTEGR